MVVMTRFIRNQMQTYIEKTKQNTILLNDRQRNMRQNKTNDDV